MGEVAGPDGRHPGADADIDRDVDRLALHVLGDRAFIVAVHARAGLRHGVLPVGKVGERLQVHPASVTNAVQRLEEAGLVTRRANPDDGRSVLAEITAAGRELVERCTRLLNDGVFSQLELSNGDVSAVVSGLERIRRDSGDFS